MNTFATPLKCDAIFSVLLFPSAVIILMIMSAGQAVRQGDLECCLPFSAYVWNVPGEYIRNTRMAKVKWLLNLRSILKGEHKYLMFVWRGIKIAQLRQHAECIQSTHEKLKQHSTSQATARRRPTKARQESCGITNGLTPITKSNASSV